MSKMEIENSGASTLLGEVLQILFKTGVDPKKFFKNYKSYFITNQNFALNELVAESSKGEKLSHHRAVLKRKKPAKNIKEKYLDLDDEDKDKDEVLNDLALTGVTYNDDGVSYANLQEQHLVFQSYVANSDSSCDFNRTLGYSQDGKNYDIRILTVVASVNLLTRLNLRDISQRSRNVEYNQKKLAPLIMRIREPKSTALMYETGKMIVSGTKNEKECRIAMRKYARILQKLGYNVQHTNFDIQYISASGNLRFPVKIHEMAKDPRIEKFVSYVAELFPGLVYTLVCPPVKAIIFDTGEFVMTGAKTEEEVRTAMSVIYPVTRIYQG